MTFTLHATTRAERGERARRAGQLPGVVYGGGKEAARAIGVDPREFLKLYQAAGEASLIDLRLDDAVAGKVLIQDVQYDPLTDRIIHLDLRQIDMTKPMTATVALRFTGVPPVVKEQGGTLVTVAHEVRVKCLPQDLVSHLDVDIGRLTSYETVIKIKDIGLPPGVVIESPHAEDVVVKAARALTEEEIKKLEEAAAAADVSKIEVAGKKPEEEAAAEGEAGKAIAPAKEEKSAKSATGGSGGKEEKKKEDKK